MKQLSFRVINIIISVLFVFSCFPIVAYAENSENETVSEQESLSFPYAMGGLPIDEAEIEKHLNNPTGEKSSLPSSIDLSYRFPVPGNQGSQNSCSGWAVAYACMSGAETKKRNWTPNSTSHAFSPSYIYNQINGGANVATNLEDALNLLKSEGVCTLTYWLYSESGFAAQPNSIQSANASLYRIKRYYSVSGRTNIKREIYKGNGVIIWINVYPELRELNSADSMYDDFSGNSLGGHYICLIGYNDSKKAFKFINSWGTNWGENGYGWIEYSSLDKYKVTGFIGAPKGYCIESQTEDHYVLGDVVGSEKKVTADDARQILRFASRLDAMTPDDFVISDVDGNGSVTAEDAQYVLKYASKQIAKLPLYN